MTRPGIEPRSHYYFFLHYFLITHQHWVVVFHWNLRYSKSPQVSRTRLSILANLNNAVISMASLHPPPPISNSSNSLQAFWWPFQPHQLHLMLLSLSCSTFSFSGKIQVLVSLFVFFDFCSVVWQDSEVHPTAGSSPPFLLLIFTRSGLLAGIRGSVSREFRVSYCPRRILVCTI